MAGGLVDTGTQRGTPLEVVHACVAAHRAQRWERLRELFHPEARIGTFAGGGRPDDPDKAIADMQRAHLDRVYQASVTASYAIDDHAAILEGRVRHRVGAGISDVERCWLYVIVDGLLFRSAVFKSRREAHGAYETHGLTLGA